VKALGVRPQTSAPGVGSEPTPRSPEGIEGAERPETAREGWVPRELNVKMTWLKSLGRNPPPKNRQLAPPFLH
jgi:hypothetical protein